MFQQAPIPILPKGYVKPELNRKVYSKYREMLGSYNDKANTMIQALPSYMVHEDTGFNVQLEGATDKNEWATEIEKQKPGRV